jgi:hypothetical protein
MQENRNHKDTNGSIEGIHPDGASPWGELNLSGGFVILSLARAGPGSRGDSSLSERTDQEALRNEFPCGRQSDLAIKSND